VPWRGPAYEGEFPSLGWQIADWYEANLKVPAGPLYGQPFRLTDDQLTFFVRLYALKNDGRRVYRRAVRRGPKGKGKSPEGGAWLLGEFCGPVVFDGWDANGEPVGVAHRSPWCWAAAVAEEQTGNIYTPMREMAADAADDLGLDLGKTRVEFRDGRPGKIEAVASSAGAREGTPTTAVAKDEPHLWMPSKGGQKMSAVINRNLGKTGGTSCSFTNAPALGERSVAEDELEQANKGQKGLLYDSVEAPFIEDPKNPDNRDDVLEALEQLYGAAAVSAGGWVDLERIYEEITDDAVTETEVRRFYFNQAVKDQSRAIDPTRWRDAVDTDRTVEDGEPVLLFFDGARTRDSAALIGWTLSGDPHLFEVEVWTRPENADEGYEHPRGGFRRAVADAFDRWDCVLCYDESFHELSSLYDEWHETFDPDETGRVIGFPTHSGKRMESAITRFITDLSEGLFTHSGAVTTTEHVHNAVLGRNRGGWLALSKPSDVLKIDAAVSAVAGYELVGTGRDVIENAGESATAFVAFV